MDGYLDVTPGQGQPTATEGGSQTSKRPKVTETTVGTSVNGTRNETVTGNKISMEGTRIDTETGSKFTDYTNQDETITGMKADKEPISNGDRTVAPDQCGLENDGSVWFPHRAPKRITVTLTTPEEQAKYQAIIDSILHKDTVYGKRVNFDPNDVIDVMIKVQPYLVSEPVLIEDVPFGVTIVGDIHGQLYDLDRVFKMQAQEGKLGYLCAKYLFLGNYVDRGLQSLEVIMLLFCLKMLYPDNFFLLRGNHDFIDVNVSYGFALECDERYCEETASLIFAHCNETFCYLSLAAIVGDIYLCVHGGISPRQFTREEMRGLTKPIFGSTDDFLIQDMMWSDPVVGMRGTVFNYDRGQSIYFGLDALVHALHSMGCKALFRGHSVMNKGFDNQWDICFTVYTATGVKNDGSIAVIDEEGKGKLCVIRKDPTRLALNDELFGEEAKWVDYGTGTGETSVYMRSEED